MCSFSLPTFPMLNQIQSIMLGIMTNYADYCPEDTQVTCRFAYYAKSNAGIFRLAPLSVASGAPTAWRPAQTDWRGPRPRCSGPG
jgi:hypothetical protein